MKTENKATDYFKITIQSYLEQRAQNDELFARSIEEIDKMFADGYKNWGAVNLKEWIDSYESTRFTQIDTHTAIITSEYNMNHVKEWLSGNIASTIHDMI